MSFREYKQLKELEKENRRLKHIYTNLSCKQNVLMDMIKKALKYEEGCELDYYLFAEPIISDWIRVGRRI